MNEHLMTADLTYAPTRHIKAEHVAENLFNATSSEVEKFRQCVVAAKGKAIVFVHPYFERYRSETEDRPANNARSLSERIDAFIRNARVGTPAIVIMEERDYIPQTRDYVKKLNAGIPVMLIPTKAGDGIPSLDFVVEGSREGYWEIVADGLRRVGVQKLYIGGMYYSRFKTKCVNVVLRGLTPFFTKVEVTSLTQPLARRNVAQVSLD